VRVGNWKQTDVAVGWAMSYSFTWAAKLITTLFVFAVLKIPTRWLSKKRTPNKCMCFMTFHIIKFTELVFLGGSVSQFHFYLGTAFELFKPHCPEDSLISSSRN